MTRPVVAALALVMLLTASASAIDAIKTSKASISGSIEEMGKYEVKIKRAGDKVDAVPTNDIETIRFDGEPPQLNLVRGAVNGGRYEEALKSLEKLTTAGVERLEVRQEIDYFRAISTARLALAGTGSVPEAGKLMSAFVTNNPGSYHFLEASETLGDLLVAVNSTDNAVKQYTSLEQAPWVDVKMRGGVAKARALQGDKKYAEAQAAYEAALALAGGATGAAVDTQKQAATIGKASCMAETGKHTEAAKLLEEVIAKADPENAQLHALAYNALGNCLRKSSNPKGALLAFLHVDVLYNTFPLAHAEALSNLTELWKETGNAERSAQAEQVLLERYSNTKWGKK